MRCRTTTALALLVVLTACSGADDPAPEAPTTSAAPDDGTAGGPVDAPTVVEPVAALLDWNDTGAEPGSRYVRGAEWRALGPRDGSTVDITRDSTQMAIGAGTGRTIAEVLLDDRWAVVVKQDKAETSPSQAVAIDLGTGTQRDLVSPEPASGGSWAMTDGDLYYPTSGDGGAYCLATLALADDNGEDAWCAEPRTGWSGLTASEHGVGMMTFDDARPVACRTVNLLEGGLPLPIDGPEKCTAWDVAATADGALWSEVPKPRRQEEAHFRASAGGTFFDLGPGLTGSALPCGDSVFFVRDPQGEDDPARLMRWTPDHTLEVAYESASVGNAFLGEPACGGGVLTVSSFGEDGDEQAWASVS